MPRLSASRIFNRRSATLDSWTVAQHCSLGLLPQHLAPLVNLGLHAMRYTTLGNCNTYTDMAVRYHIEFIGRNGLAFEETPVSAKSAAVAIEEAGKLAWPGRAVALRIFDLYGQEIYRINREGIH
jgi:hypothetical protein